MGRERVSFKITFYLRRTRVTKAGLAPILSRITVNGIAAEIPVKCHIYPERWDQTKERATGKDKLSTEVNTYLDSYRARVLEIRREIEQEGKEVSVFEIKERLTHPAKTRMFLEEFAAYCEKRQKEVGVMITKHTLYKYRRALRYLSEYTVEEYKKSDLPLSSINYYYIEGFKLHIQTRHCCRHNGAVNLLKVVRTFFLYCIRNEWIDKSPMKDMKLVEEPTEVRANLSKSELERMLVKAMPNERIERVRDIFVFCCLTGLAFTDVHSLGPEHLGRDEKGKLWIIKPRNKTGIKSTIPLLPIAMQILDKYADNPTCKMKGKLLPVCSNQRMNSYLTELADLCGIDKKLTTHCARHTFASVAGNYGMPLKVIARILGHAKVKMTEHYTHLWESTVSEEMEKLGEKIDLSASVNILKAQ